MSASVATPSATAADANTPEPARAPAARDADAPVTRKRPADAPWFSLELEGFAAAEASRLRAQRRRLDDAGLGRRLVSYGPEPAVSLVDLCGRLDDGGRADALAALRGLVDDLVRFCATDTLGSDVGKAKAELIERLAKVVGFDADDAHGMIVSQA